MELSLGEALADGRCGIVHRVEVLRILSADGTEVPGYSLPPLVVKVAGLRYTPHIAREAWFYDELETLQGSVIPRCFGFFEATLPQNTAIIPWRVHGLDRGRHEYDIPYAVDMNGPDDGEEPENFDCLDDFSSDVKIKRSRHDPRVPSPLRVSLLLMEELDQERLPVGMDLTDEIRWEIYDILEELNRFEVVHNDVARRNILRFPRSPNAYPCLPSPYTGRTYNWRILDFNDSRKFDLRDCEILNESMAEYLIG